MGLCQWVRAWKQWVAKVVAQKAKLKESEGSLLSNGGTWQESKFEEG